MKKEELKRIRNNMIRDIWEEKKSIWTMEELGYLFGLKIAQIYRVLKKEYNKKVENKI